VTRPWDPDGQGGAPVPAGTARGAARRSRSGWRTFGLVLAVIVAIAGLALLAVILFFYAAFNDYGSNK
jgi:hypothetical protein